MVEFEWDEGNIPKILARFALEQVEEFFKRKPYFRLDEKHSKDETRFLAAGEGPSGKPMLVCFTFRNDKIRVISARHMRKKEAIRYEKFKENQGR